MARLGGRQTFGRFQSSYNAGLGHARMLLYKGARESWSGTEDELAQYVRNLTGGLDTRALGVGPGARQAENLWLAFSPRLLRSTIAIVADGILKPTSPQGQRALRTLGTWLAGAHGIYVLSGLAMGKDWDELAEGLNPLNGKRYLSHQINGDWVGVGGQARAMSQLIWGLTMGAYQEPSSLWAPNLQENPLLRFVSGRGAVGLNIVGGAVEAGTGGKVNALQFDDVDGSLDYLAHLGTSALPFVVQGLLEGEQWPTAGAAMVGARTSPETPYDRRRTHRAAALRRRGVEVGEYLTDDEWKGLASDTRADIDDAINANNPEIPTDIKELNEQWDSDTYYYQSKLADIEDAHVRTLDVLWSDSMQDGKYPWGKKFRERVDELRGEKARDLKALRDSADEFIFATDDNTDERVRMKNPSYDPRMRSALDEFEEWEPSEHEFNMALTEYIEVMYGQDSPDEKELMSLKLVDAATPEHQIQELWGEYDYDERERRERFLQEKLGATMFERVKKYLRRGDPDAVQQLDADREVLAESGYWKANETVIQDKSDYVQRAWTEYLDEPDPVLKASIISKYDHPAAKSGNIIRDLINERDDIRLAIRSSTPEVTAILLRHGYCIQAPKDWEGVVPWLEYDQKTSGDSAWIESYPWASVPTP